MRVRRWHVVAILVALAAIIMVAKAQGAVTSASMKPLKIGIGGGCRSAAYGPGQIQIVGTGFTPGGKYTWTIRYPNDRPYTFDPFHTHHATDVLPLGVIHLSVSCGIGADGKPDPPGAYKIKVTDESTGRSITTTYRVLPTHSKA